MAHLNLTPAPDATSFASSSTPKRFYNVFINSGSEVKGLASLIYRALISRGLTVFLDIYEMERGEPLNSQIEAATRTASVHVAVFSPEYAKSSWCLDELVQMLESRSPIIPVYYNVKPSDLRWTRHGHGVYASALSVLEKMRAFDSQPRYDSKTVEKWRKALSDVAEMIGFELEAFNGEEGVLVDRVVKAVLTKVTKRLLSVARYPTGLDDKVNFFEMTVLSQEQSENSARVVGIVGAAGVGKTTLVKELFNRYTSNYDLCLFLDAVRERAARHSLNSLQATLLKNLTQLNLEINSVTEGIEKLKRHVVYSPPALVVLDDVDHIDQLDALLSPIKYTINSCSLILVTSRNKDVLTSAGIVESSIYTVKGLNLQHSQELFCSHAFRQSYPVIGFEQLVEKFLGFCDGLPLSLIVMGARLNGQDFNYWEAQLDKVSILLPEEILRRLKISYDSLDEEEKDIFLDIACFFVGEYRDTAVRIWDGSGWEGCLGFRNLENRSMVEVDSENRIRLHPHLEAMGKRVAQYREQREHRVCRLWRPHGLLDNLPEQLLVRGIRTVHRNGPQQSFQNITKYVDTLSRLQLLWTEGDFLERAFSVGFLQQLVYLHWDNYPYYSFPPATPALRMDNLRVLHIKGEKLETLWPNEFEAPLQLRELVIRAKHLKISESIGKLKHLEKFVLQRNDLETSPDSFENFTSLEELDLSGCSNLRPPLNVSEYHTGLDDKVKDVEMTLLSQKQSENSARVVGIVGPGGVGKTTLAKELFNRLKSKYERSCFLYDLRENEAGGSLVCLQVTLLKDLVQSNKQIHSLDEGEEMIKRYLSSSHRVLLVLDDVHHQHVMDALFSPVYTIHSSSLILITSRNKDVLRRAGIVDSSIYIVKGLNQQQSRELFCLHAFNQPYPVRGSEQLVESFLDACDGLPLSLKVNGARLRGINDLNYWKAQLRKVKRILPEDIQRSLQISYDSLAADEKQMFLDIACFFVGEYRDTAVRIWDGSGWCGRKGFWSLENRSMVEVDCENRIRLHPHLEVLGKHVAENMLVGRLWRPIDNPLRDLPDHEHVRGIRTVRGNGAEQSFQNIAEHVGSPLSSKLSRLELLWTEGYFLERSFSDVSFRHLVYLHWDNYPYYSFPPATPAIGMYNLRVLDIKGEKLEALWPNESQEPLQLRELNICAKLLKVPESIGKLKYLEKFILQQNDLETLPDSFENLTSLDHLDLSGCSNLRMLPDSFGRFRYLKHIDLSGCSNLQTFPQGMWKLN